MEREIFLKDFLEQKDPWFATRPADRSLLRFDGARFKSRGETLLIRDIPGYFEIDRTSLPGKVALATVTTHQGFYVDLARYGDSETYFQEAIGSRSRSNLRRYRNRLETCFDIAYRDYFGAIELDEYNRLFEVVEGLLVRRFREKGEENYELQHLGHFQAVLRDMILDKKAHLFVIYHGHKPISIRINMFRDKMAYYIISGYDIDYSKFHLGFIDMAMSIQWMFANGFDRYDLLKGYGYYKKKWTRDSYFCRDCYIYDRSRPVAWGVTRMSVLKSRIRYGLYRWLKNRPAGKLVKSLRKTIAGPRNAGGAASRVIEGGPAEIQPEKLGREIDIENQPEYRVLRQPVYRFLFYSREAYRDLRVYAHKERDDLFFIRGRNKSQTLVVQH